jgi:hypothetical protein
VQGVAPHTIGNCFGGVFRRFRSGFSRDHGIFDLRDRVSDSRFDNGASGLAGIFR